MRKKTIDKITNAIERSGKVNRVFWMDYKDKHEKKGVRRRLRMRLTTKTTEKKIGSESGMGRWVDPS